MHIILGAFGQVGRRIVSLLEDNGQPVRRLTSNKENLNKLSRSEIIYADYFNGESLKTAFDGGDTVVLLTPESISSDDPIGDAKKVFDNYRYALKGSSIKKVIALSSVGAQATPGTGTLQLYAMLEDLVINDCRKDNPDLSIVVVRPSYYYSNWMMSLDGIKSDNCLMTYFPENISIPMISPMDVSKFISDILLGNDSYDNKIVEITNSKDYTPRMIADLIGDKLKRSSVDIFQIPSKDWLLGLIDVGFSEASAEFMMQMTSTVINHKTGFITKPIYMETSFLDYMDSINIRG